MLSHDNEVKIFEDSFVGKEPWECRVAGSWAPLNCSVKTFETRAGTGSSPARKAPVKMRGAGSDSGLPEGLGGCVLSSAASPQPSFRQRLAESSGALLKVNLSAYLRG